MADTPTATDSTKNEKAKTVAENMAARRIFPNIDEAVAYLQASAASIPDFSEQTIAAPGMDESGNFDEQIYGGQSVMVSVLKKQGQGVKAIVVAPVPTVDQLLESEAGRQWVEKILNKELNHVAVRHLRDAEDVTTVIDQMPTTLDAYITSERGAGGGMLESYDELYKLINATLAQKVTAWAKQRFIKSELRKALESAGYAREYFPQLEDYKGESLFVLALQLGINAAKRKGLDPTIFERWLANRDAKAFTATDEEEDFDIDNLTDSLLEEEEGDESAPATEGNEAEAGQETEAESEAETEGENA